MKTVNFKQGIEKIGEHSTKTYYRITVGNDTQIVVIDKFNNYTEEEILKAYPDAKVPSYIPEEHIDDLFNNPLRIFDLVIYKTWVELNPKCMSVWEYETLIKGKKDVNPALKMAFISQDRDNNTFCINCESYDYESMVNSRTVTIFEKWMDCHIEELKELLNMEYVGGDILY